MSNAKQKKPGRMSGPARIDATSQRIAKERIKDEIRAAADALAPDREAPSIVATIPEPGPKETYRSTYTRVVSQ